MKKKYFKWLGVLLLGGCTANPILRPEAGQKIELDFVNISPEIQVAVVVYQDDYDCFDQHIFRINGSEALKSIVENRSNQTVTYQYLNISRSPIGVGLGVESCLGTFTFPTDRGDRFRIQFGRYDKSCGVSVTAESNDGLTAPVRVALIKRVYKRPFIDSHGPWCEPEERYKGSSNLANPRDV